MTGGSRPGFVLVHGGEHGPWCWERLVPRVDWPALAVAVPGRDQRAGDPTGYRLRDGAEAVMDAVASTAFDPCIVVCHSMGVLDIRHIDAGHEVMLSHPEILATDLNAIGRAHFTLPAR